MLVLTLVIYKSNRFDTFGILFARSAPMFVKYLLNSSVIIIIIIIIIIFHIKNVSFIDSNFSWKS